ncbi:MAG TPA: FtsX-like permease family protein [Candidatus Saccharimonadales bacterium]|nr:FtsX-like permease family protein [Candidatus Saccharimonadales bacterium]
MNVVSRGIRNAFRNSVRTISIVVILGLSTGLALAMLVAHQAVSTKIASVKGSIGNTISIAPAGFSGFSQVNNSLTTAELSKVTSLPHVVSVQESLTDRLTTIGSTAPSFGGFGGSSSTSSTTNQTSLTSPVTINTGGGSGGGRTFISGGGGLPANFTPPITITGTNDTSSINGTYLTITSGTAINGASDSNDAMISQSMASKNSLKVGSTFTAYSTTMTVTGVFTVSSDQASANTVLVSLPTEQRLSNQAGDVTSAVATVDSLDNLNSATTSIKNILGSSADVTSAQTEANNTVAPLNSVKTVSLYSVIGAVIAGGVIILLTMVMIVRERRREIGVVKAIGASDLKVITQFATEAVTLTLMGAVVGIVLGVVAGNPITKLLVNNSSSSPSPTAGGLTRGAGGFGGGGGAARFVSGGRGVGGFLKNNLSNIHAAVGWDIIIYGIVGAIVIAIVGSVFVAFFISKIRPAEVLRTE